MIPDENIPEDIGYDFDEFDFEMIGDDFMFSDECPCWNCQFPVFYDEVTCPNCGVELDSY